MKHLTFKIADREAEFEAIHRLNYRTFVEEIPQHPPNAEQRLVDTFHDENSYAVCLDGERLVGMLAGRGRRPFSLDRKLSDLDALLPPHRQPLEIRLLAVEADYRKTEVFARLVATLAERFAGAGHDLAVISGTLRQTRLYAHLGFRPFGPQVGTKDAPYQPMYLDLAAYGRLAPRLAQLPPQSRVASMLPGPVPIAPGVAAAFAVPPESHRSRAFLRMHREVRETLCDLTGAQSALLMAGSGTLANDAVAAQLSLVPGPGLIISNGEFGERLADHARRWRLEFHHHRLEWGGGVDMAEVDGVLSLHPGIRWLWAVACETSTGVMNPVAALADCCLQHGVELCLDAISALGTLPLRLDRVRFASAVSGKALGAYPGIGIVFSSGPLAPAGLLPRSLDLTAYRDGLGVPYTLSSNLLAALHAAVTGTDWLARFDSIAAASIRLRRGLHAHGFRIVADDIVAAPAVTTLSLPPSIDGHRLCRRLGRAGYRLAHESDYLSARNWIQACLMGDFNPAWADTLPELLGQLAGEVALRED